MERIYEVHKPTMLRYALKITNNKEIAEDAVHDAFLSLIKHKDKLFPLSHDVLRTSVIIITKNKCIDLLRKNSFFADKQTYDMEDDPIADDTFVEDIVILCDEYASVRKHVASLDEASRLVLEMKYIIGMTYKEIGEELGITAKHVDTKIMRAKSKVRMLMAAGGESVER